MRLDRSQSGWSTCETDGGDKCAESEIGQGLLRRWRECSHCGAPRAKPAADQSGDQCATAAAKGKGDGAYRKTEQSDQQSNRQTTGEICNVGPVVGTEGLPNLRKESIQILFEGDKRHDVAHINAGAGCNRDFLAVTGQLAQEYAARLLSEAIDDILQCPAVQVARGYKHLDDLSGDGTHDVFAFNLRADHRSRCNNYCRRPGEQDLIACL